MRLEGKKSLPDSFFTLFWNSAPVFMIKVIFSLEDLISHGCRGVFYDKMNAMRIYKNK
jgi:hypothetical protein